jgi:hypothetical protein
VVVQTLLRVAVAPWVEMEELVKLVKLVVPLMAHTISQMILVVREGGVGLEAPEVEPSS